MAYILKQPKPTGRAQKSKRYNKNHTKNILGGVMRPKDNKKYRLNNNLKKPKKARLSYGLISGFDMAFNNNQELKDWLNEFKHSINRPTNVKHNLNYKDNPLYHNKDVYRFDMMIRDREF